MDYGPCTVFTDMVMYAREHTNWQCAVNGQFFLLAQELGGHAQPFHH